MSSIELLIKKKKKKLSSIELGHIRIPKHIGETNTLTRFGPIVASCLVHVKQTPLDFVIGLGFLVLLISYNQSTYLVVIMILYLKKLSFLVKEKEYTVSVALLGAQI